MRLWVKHCGFTKPEDIAHAAALKVDAIGIVCVPGSPRFVDEESLAQLARVPRDVSRLVLVFQDAETEFVRSMISIAQPELLQFHGTESPEFVEQFNLPYIMATRDLAALDLLKPHRRAFAWLIDHPLYDGSLSDYSPVPIIIAGQLTCDNILQRVHMTRPFGVDVSRGIERVLREKDHEVMTKFMQQALKCILL